MFKIKKSYVQHDGYADFPDRIIYDSDVANYVRDTSKWYERMNLLKLVELVLWSFAILSDTEDEELQKKYMTMKGGEPESLDDIRKRRA